MDVSIQTIRSYDEEQVPTQISGENKKGLYIILFQFFASNMIVMNAFAFYPLFIEDFYPQITSFWTGVFLAIPDLAILLLGIPIGELVIKTGRTKSIRIASLTVLLSTFVLALLTLIEHDEHLFFWSSIIFRFIFGLGYIGVFVVGFATIASDFGENSGKYNGYGEGLGGLGLFVGPIIGSFFYKHLGFFEGQIFLTCVYLLCTILVFFYYPLERSIHKESHSSIQQNISYKEILTTKVAFIYLFMLFYIQITTSFILPIFTVNLKQTFNLHEGKIAVIFTAGQLVCALTAMLASKLSSKSRRRWLSALGLLILSISIFLMGPSEFLGLPNSYKLILVAMLLNGSGFTLVFIHVTPEVIRSVSEAQGIEPGSNEQLNERASTLFEFVFSLGQFIGPPIGGALADNIGYRGAIDVIAFFSVLCGIFATLALFIKR